MEAEFFEDFVLKNRLYLIEKTLGSKGDEYARGDRLSNFKKAASFLGCSPEKALWGFVTKHIIALNEFIVDIENGKPPSAEQMNEKMGDIHCYLVLLEALRVEADGSSREH